MPLWVNRKVSLIGFIDPENRLEIALCETTLGVRGTLQRHAEAPNGRVE